MFPENQEYMIGSVSTA